MVGEVLTVEDTGNVGLSIPGRLLSFATGSLCVENCRLRGWAQSNYVSSYSTSTNFKSIMRPRQHTALFYKKCRKRVMNDIRINDMTEALIAVLSTTASMGIDVDLWASWPPSSCYMCMSQA